VNSATSGMAGNLSHFRIAISVDKYFVCIMGGVAQKGDRQQGDDYYVKYVTNAPRVKYFRFTTANSVE
jgi:hypothetical protein